MLGFHVLFVLLWEWETLIPKVTPLPQYSHFAMCRTSFKLVNINSTTNIISAIPSKGESVNSNEVSIQIESTIDTNIGNMPEEDIEIPNEMTGEVLID